MSEIVVETTPQETIIEIDGGPTLTTTIEQEQQTVVETPAEPVVIDLNSGARGEPGSAILIGIGFPTMALGTVGDMYLVGEGSGIGTVLIKRPTEWTIEGNIRGPEGGIDTVNGYTGPDVTLTKFDLGLGAVNNSADADKPVSVPQQEALDNLESSLTLVDEEIADDLALLGIVVGTKQDFIITGTSAQYYRGDKTWQTLNKAAVGLANVDNTSDSAKPISTATQGALDLKAPLASPAFTGTVTGITKAMVGLGNADNTSDANKPVSTAQQTALNLKVNVSGEQTINDTKTFASSPIVPTPTSDSHAANKLYIDTAVANLVSSAPGLLDTLDELAAALGDDPNFATTVTASIATKEPVISAGTTGQYWRGDKSWQTLDKNVVGLSLINNVAQVEIAGAQTITGIKTFSAAPVVPDAAFAIAKTSGLQAALDLKAPLASPTFTGTITGNGSGLTALNGTNISTGTVADARLSTNVALLAGTQTFSGAKTFSGLITASAGITVTGTVTATTFSGSGANLTALGADKLTTGTVNQNQLKPNIQRVDHGSAAAFTRPTGSTFVEWVGSVQPTGMIAGDTWMNTSASGNVSDNYPAGSVFASASAKTAAPSGFYWMEGQQILISGDTALYNELTNNGTVFPYGTNTNGAGAAGSTHFRLPNGLGRTIVHTDGTTEFTSIGKLYGTKNEVLLTTQIPAHNHGVNDPGHYHDTWGRGVTWYANNTWGGTDIYFGVNATGGDPGGIAGSNFLVMGSNWQDTFSSSTGISTQNAGGGGSHNNVQPSIMMRYMIKR